MHVKTHTHSVTTASDPDVGDFTLDFEPNSDVELKVVGDRAVLGYLVYDSDCENPMTSCDCMGEFITEDDRSDSPWSHLGLLEKPYRGEIQRDLECDGVHEEALRLIAPGLITNRAFLEFCEENYDRITDEDECDMAFAEACLEQIDFKYDNVPLWLQTKYEVACEDAWDRLYERGEIGTYLAVPFRWHESVHGPCTAEAYPCSIEDCNAVWIPTPADIDNIKCQVLPEGVEVKWHLTSERTNEATVFHLGESVFQSASWREAQAYIDANFPATTHADLYNAAVKYAEGCLDQYVTWANGEAYGFVVESFTREDDEWVKDEQATDSCWGHVGYEWAQEALKEAFDYQCKHFLKEEQ